MTGTQIGDALAAGAAIVGIMWVPGLLVGRSWGLRGLPLWGTAPALSLAIIGPATFLAARSGQSWGLHTLLLGWPAWLTLAGVACGLLAVLGGRGWSKQPDAARPGLRGWLALRPGLALGRGARAVAAGIAFAAVMTAGPMLAGTGGLESPAQASDAVFHLSATRFVRETGNASFLGGLAPMYDGHASYYPTAWHAITALASGSVVLGANVLVIVLCSLVWPVGMAALIREVTRARGAMLGVAVALSGSVCSLILLATSVWPYALSVAVLPGALAVLVRALRCGEAACGLSRQASAWAVALAAALGVVMAHGAGVFNLAVLGGPLVAAGVLPVARRAWVRGGVARARLVAVLCGGFALVGAGAWVMRASLISVFSFPRGAANMWETLFALVSDHPLLARFTPWIPGNILIALLALAAVAPGRWGRRAPRRRAGRGRRTALGGGKRTASNHNLSGQPPREWIVAAGLAITLLLLAAGPAWPGRMLAGPWYTQRARIMPLVTITLLVLACYGIERLQVWSAGRDFRSGWGDRLSWHVPAVVLVLSLVVAPAWRWPLKEEILQAVHEPSRVSYGTMLDGDELALVRRAASELPADAVVVGDPSNGSPYLWSVAGVRVLYPSRPEPTYSADLLWVGKHLGQIETDKRVCSILRERGVDFYYSDSADAARAPLWGSDWDIPERALTRIDSGGTATLWRINYAATPCDVP